MYVTVARNALGKITPDTELIMLINMISASGLTRHKSSCLGASSSSSSRSLTFTCPSCQKTFGQKRYLDQHLGGKKCEQRRGFLERTAFFTLALTASPGTASMTRTLSCSENEKVILI